MKPTFIKRIQQMGQKAAQVKQAVQALPSQAAEIREAVVASAGQLHQLGTEIKSSMAGLQLHTGERLMAALQEIHDRADVLADAGYELRGVDLELDLVQRLIVRLEKCAHVPAATLRSLASEHQNRATLHAVLQAIIKADELADKVRLTDFSYRELTLDLGTTPSVRVSWRADQAQLEVEPPTAPAPSSAVTTSPLAGTGYGQSSFFERPLATSASSAPAAVASQTTPAIAAATSTTPHSTSARTTASDPKSSDWGREALDRFKKMPNLSRHRK